MKFPMRQIIREKKKIGIALSAILVMIIGEVILKKQKNIGLETTHDHHAEEKEDHEKKQGHEEKKEVSLSDAQMKRFDIQTIKLTKNNFKHRLTVPGQIALNENNITHVVASVPGTVKEIFKGLGEPVKIGEPIAALKSRDMAEAKSSYISAHKNLELQKNLYDRDEKLFKQKIKAEVQFVQMRNLYENSKILVEQTKQKLLALGMTEDIIQQLPKQTTPLNLYTIESPIDGKIIERHITLGEVVSGDRQVFVIANLDTVWVSLAIPAEDLHKIKKDQNVEIFVHQGEQVCSGTIMYVSPVINEDSRTGQAIIQLDNKKGELHPGDFVKAQVIVSEQSSFLNLPNSTIQRIDGKSVVFVKTSEQIFEARPIEIKGSDKAEFIEIMGGLKEGDEIIVKNAFFLKAELGKSEAEHSH